MPFLINPYRFASGGVTYPTPASDWRFNEGSGTTAADTKGVATFTYGALGTPTWGSGFLTIGSSAVAATDVISTPANTYAQTLTDWTFVAWVKPGHVSSGFEDLFALGLGTSSSAGNYSMFVGQDVSTNKVLARISDGTNLTALNGTVVMTTTDLWMVALRYVRVADLTSEFYLDYTKTGTFESQSSTTARLMKVNSSAFALWDRRNVTTAGDKTLYRYTLWTSKLTNTDLANIWAAGSESTLY